MLHARLAWGLTEGIKKRMRKPRNLAVFAACALLAAPSLASAATVSGASGAVLVSDGTGFVPLTGPGEFAPGTQVMVKPGQVATIAYGNCTVKIGSDRVWIVQAAAPCTDGVGEIDLTTRMNQSASPLVTSNGGVAVVSTLIGLAVVGVIACISVCKDKSTSP